jgi:hypothetical protein
MDDFYRFWQWANKPLDSGLAIPADIHHAVTSLPLEARRDRAKVNEALRIVQETGIPRYIARKSRISTAGDRCTNTRTDGPRSPRHVCGRNRSRRPSLCHLKASNPLQKQHLPFR